MRLTRPGALARSRGSSRKCSRYACRARCSISRIATSLLFPSSFDPTQTELQLLSVLVLSVLAANRWSIIPTETLMKLRTSTYLGHDQWLEFRRAHGSAHRLAGGYPVNTA